MAIKNLDYREPGSAVLICCLLDYCHYTEINDLATYIIDNFADVEDLLRGQCKVDNTFFNALLHFLSTFKFMKPHHSRR
ncbi:hypothetical protein NQ318_017792 [Aromia moschata]|uniref:Sesquiterpene synthase n=1 Tax=Aromia moschata TaxID=1265417 RepID=A0AAV8XXL6_9CUCU|nr:hypothetical protein NQ318_017792 [Aromia moschata]